MRKYWHLLFILLLFACKKAENRRCIKFTGVDGSKRVELPAFHKLVLKKGIKYVLVQDDTNYLNITGGENLLNFIEFQEIEEGVIQIENKNKCNFLRKYSSHLSVEIHFIEMKEIRFEGTEDLTSKDTLHFQDFKFEVIDACGTFNINLKANKVIADIPFGFGNYILSGIVQNAELGIKSNGFCNTENLEVLNELNVTNDSQGDMYINANQKVVKGSIRWKGNIYYKGEILADELSYYDSGKLIKN